MEYIIYIRQEDITVEAQSQTQTFCPIVRCAPLMFTQINKCNINIG